MGSGLTPDGSAVVGSGSSNGGGGGGVGGLTAHDALSAEPPPDGPSSEWMNNAVNARDMLTTGGIVAADNAAAAGASRGMNALTVVDGDASMPGRPTATSTLAAATAAPVGGFWMPPPTTAVTHRGRTVADVLSSDPAFSKLCAALSSTGFLDDLRGVDGGEYTVFAPTNAAIMDECRALGITEQEFNTSPDLHHVVRSHVIVGKKFWSSFHGQHSVATTSGAEFALGGQNGFGQGAHTVGDASLLALDMAASNGVVHVISKVLGNLGVVTQFRRPSGRLTTRSE